LAQAARAEKRWYRARLTFRMFTPHVVVWAAVSLYGMTTWCPKAGTSVNGERNEIGNQPTNGNPAF
jgi:hypothetical protein